MSTILDYFQWSTIAPHFVKCNICKYAQKCKLKKQKNNMVFHLKKSHNNVWKKIMGQQVF